MTLSAIPYPLHPALDSPAIRAPYPGSPLAPALVQIGKFKVEGAKHFASDKGLLVPEKVGPRLCALPDRPADGDCRARPCPSLVGRGPRI